MWRAESYNIKRLLIRFAAKTLWRKCLKRPTDDVNSQRAYDVATQQAPNVNNHGEGRTLAHLPQSVALPSLLVDSLLRERPHKAVGRDLNDASGKRIAFCLPWHLQGHACSWTLDTSNVNREGLIKEIKDTNPDKLGAEGHAGKTA